MDYWHILNQVVFGGVAAAGFGVLFNCPHRFLWSCFAAGALALLARTVGQELGLDLPVASFLAALVLALATRFFWNVPTVAGTVLAVVGCIPMVPGSLAATGLKNFFDLLHAQPADRAGFAIAGLENLSIVSAILVGMGAAIVLPSLIFPEKQKAVA